LSLDGSSGQPGGFFCFYWSRRLCGPTTVATGSFNLSHQDFNALHQGGNPSASRFAIDPISLIVSSKMRLALAIPAALRALGIETIAIAILSLTGNGGFEICALLRG
jgi:hypothetical protein